MRGTIAKDVVQVSWNIRAFGYPVFPEMAYSKDKAGCAELFKEPETANKREIQQRWHS